MIRGSLGGSNHDSMTLFHNWNVSVVEMFGEECLHLVSDKFCSKENARAKEEAPYLRLSELGQLDHVGDQACCTIGA